MLCVDDDADALDAIATLVGGWGAHVVTAASLAEARRAVAQARFDVLLADYQLDDDRSANGLDIIAGLREIQPGLAAILITANRSESLQATARSSAIPLLHKPLRAMRLRALLEAVSRRRS